jgi:exonuclease SbcC
VAAALGRHLRANAFERWLLKEAFEQLVEAGSLRLCELSSGDYSFAVDDKLDFQIIDHRNADETRSAKTLSGGEIFLASLALALTLAEQVAGLAADGAAPLESMFLDEGFGTLDEDALETALEALAELKQDGKLIGVISHVGALKERIDTQINVHTASGGRSQLSGTGVKVLALVSA